ncbi:hypothetical protein GXP67_01055 [Rhodocytophaga rosea]|uniref:Uncharacterized protein n=1 Tax=Rhodocytophaga rosea TaxID=2704465 RepID=A0A6C0GBP2_9BACT|nr:hypothetical protein [Rhodocytophaga rosea]QHT65361.1 hypothetical protein GXP67_01055 [Rhodocytophaga rosea]
MKKNLPPKDLKGSKYKIVIYFFSDAAQSKTRKQDFYSKFLGQKEPVKGFVYWRNRIYWYIEHSQFGIKWAAIYDNKNLNREKEPILTILGNGAELANKIEISSVGE